MGLTEEPMLTTELDTIDAAVEELRPELVRITSDLISFRTTRLTGTDFKECAEYLRDEYSKAGFSAEVLEVPQEERRRYDVDTSHYRALGLRTPVAPRFNVIGHAAGLGNGPSLHVNGHYCVVEPGDGWSGDPWTSRLVDGNIIGRGAIDMKSGLAAAIVAFRAIAMAGVRNKGDVYVSATIDTHFGGDLGAGYIARNGIGRAARVIITDTSGPSRILLGYRGQLWMDVLLTGAAAHGSTPSYGSNPVVPAAKILLGLDALRERLQEHVSVWQIRPESSRRPSLTAGTLMSSSAWVNLVPAQYRIGIDRRLLPEETVEEAKAEIAAVVDDVKRQHPDTPIELRELFGVPGTATAADDPLVVTVADHIRRVTEQEPDTLVHPAFLDLQWFTSAWGVPGIVYGPGDGGGGTDFRRKPYTEPDEHVPVDDVVTAARVLAGAFADLTA